MDSILDAKGFLDMEDQNWSKPLQPTQGASDVADHLIALLTIENSALRVMDFARAGAILAAKCATADALAATLRSASTDGLSRETRQTLRSLDKENQELQHRSSRIQRRIHTLLARLAEDDVEVPDPPLRMRAAPSRFTRPELNTRPGM